MSTATHAWRHRWETGRSWSGNCGHRGWIWSVVIFGPTCHRVVYHVDKCSSHCDIKTIRSWKWREELQRRKDKTCKEKITISWAKEHRASHKRPLRFLEENYYENEIFSILSGAQALTSVILVGKRNSRLHSVTGCYNVGKCRSDGNKVCQVCLSNVRSFNILRAGEGLTSNKKYPC